MASTVKVGITAEDEGFGQSLQQMASDASKFAKEVGVSGKGVAGLTASFRTARKAAMDLSLAYSQLSDEAKNSDFGRAMKEQLDKAKDAASQLLDMKGDISQELSNMASDTATWDSLSQGIDVVGTSATALIGIFSDVNGESETAAETLKAMATVQSSLNAVISIGNAIQKQSSLMKGISNIQSKASTLAKTMETKATVGATLAQKAFNAVAKANPYVLLATAVLAVSSAIAIYAKNSADAKKKEEELQKAQERAKKLNDTYADTVVDNSAEMITKWIAVEEASKKENLTQEEKNNIYEAAQPIVAALGDEVNNFAELEDWIPKNKDRVINALAQRAVAMAEYAVAIEEAKEMIRTLAEQETRVKAVAGSVGQTLSAEQWAKQGVDNKYLKPKYETKDVFAQGEMTQQKILVGYTLDQASYKKMQDDVEKQITAAEQKIRNKISKRIKSAISNENAAAAILGDGKTPTKTHTPKTTHKTSSKNNSNATKGDKEKTTAVEKINKALEAEQKKLENINTENDKDGSKKKAVYATMLKLNQQKEKYYDVDDTGFDKLKGTLYDELKLVKANSSEWDEIQQKIKNANDKRLLVTLSKGNAGLEESLALLRENRNLVKEGSDEWKEYTQHINDVENLIAKMNISHVAGSLGYIQDLISGLEDVKVDIDINTKDGMKSLLGITNQIADLTSEQQVIDIYINSFLLDKFEERYNKLLDKFKDNEDITLIIKTQIADNAKAQISALSETFSNGFIDSDTFKSKIDGIFNYLESKGIDTSKFTKDLVDGISGSMSNQNDMLSLGLIDTSTFVENISKMKQQLVDLGVSGEAAMRMLNTSGVNALSDLQSKYDEGIIDKDEFLQQFETLKQALEALGLDIKIKPELETSKWEKDLNNAADAVNSLGSAFSSLGEMSEDPTLKIAGIIAQSIANIALGAGKAIAKSGDLGPWGWLAFGASIMAQMAAMIAQVHSATGYAEGGIIKGSTTMGDHLIARVNAGEAILNTRQQARLFDMIDHGQMYNNAEPQVSTVRIKGSDIYLSLKNYSKISGKTSFGNGINIH